MKKLFILLVVFVVGCTSGPSRQDYQTAMDEKVNSPFFYVPALNQKDFADRTWILLAESISKIWFYDPYTLTEDQDGIISFDAFFSPREKNSLAPFNATIVGPYLQKIDCFSNNQWSETLYTKNMVSKAPLTGDTKPVNGSGWVKIAPRTSMAYVRTRLCGRKFIDDQNVNYFLYQEGALPALMAQKAPVEIFDEKLNKQIALPKEEVVITANDAKPPIFYDVINNEVSVIDVKKDIRQMRLSSYVLGKDLAKQADYIFTANCQENSYSLTTQGQGPKSSGPIGARDSMAAVAFNRACGNHGAYMKPSNKSRN
jgi:hypothetical protein